MSSRALFVFLFSAFFEFDASSDEIFLDVDGDNDEDNDDADTDLLFDEESGSFLTISGTSGILNVTSSFFSFAFISVDLISGFVFTKFILIAFKKLLFLLLLLLFV